MEGRKSNRCREEINIKKLRKEKKKTKAKLSSPIFQLTALSNVKH